MNGNLFDYMIPVEKAGDAKYSNGQQELEPSMADKEKALETLKALALKKQLQLENSNAEHILKILQSDTPDAAIYRALLLQQLEKTKELKKEEEDKKPGVLKSAAKFVGNAALNTAKYIGMLALQYLMFQTIMRSRDIYNKGFKKTWEEWLNDNGVAKTPSLAEQNGDSSAAIGNDIIKRNVKFKDMSPEQQKAVFGLAQDKGISEDLNTMTADFSLKSMLKKDGEYFDELPKDANINDYTKEWAMFLNPGKGNSIPISKDDLGETMYNNIFKAGDLRTVITPDDNWFTGNSFIRGMDNAITHIGDITGSNELKRKKYMTDTEYIPIKKQPRISNEEMIAKKLSDGQKTIQENTSNLLGNLEVPGRYNQAYFDIDPKKLDKVLDDYLSLKPERQDYVNILSALNVNTHKGINMGDLETYLNKALDHKLKTKSKKELLDIYETLNKESKSWGIPKMPWYDDPHIKSDFKASDTWYNQGRRNKYKDIGTVGATVASKSLLVASIKALAGAVMGAIMYGWMLL